MARHSNISKATKLKAVLEYKEGYKGPLEISDELNVHKNTIREWWMMYDAQGEKAFDRKPQNRAYSKETKKISAAKDYISGQFSPQELMAKYEISSRSILKAWVRKYNGHEELKDYDPKGEVYMAKHRQTTYEERLEIVHYCLRHDRKYAQAAEAYDVSYTQVYQWVKKYDAHGEEGLLDRRGKTKRDQDLSETEKLKRENDRLRQQNERLKIESDVLKKLKEIEKRRASQKSGKK